MPEIIKDWWSQIVIVVLMAIGYGRQTQRLNSLEKGFANHCKDCKDAGYMTLPQHDRIQESCQNEWRGEFKHFRSEMSTGFQHVSEALTDIKSDIKELRDKK